MRRLLAILLAAAPAVALAQTSGQLLFDSNTTATISKTKCQGSDTIALSWRVKEQLVGDFVAGTGQFDVFAASQDKTDTSFPPCYYDGNVVSGVTSGLVASVTSPTSTLGGADVAAADIITKAGFDCTTADKTVYVCAVWKNAAGTVKAYAKGSVSLKIASPAKPVVTAVGAGDGALYVVAEAGARVTGDAEATDFVARAVACPTPTTCGTTSHDSDLTPIGTEVRMGGLVNGTPYRVTAFAYSADGNVSDESDPWATDVAPRHVRDAWEKYKVDGGRDSGGCDAGPAGLLALLGAAALLRLRRRS